MNKNRYFIAFSGGVTARALDAKERKASAILPAIREITSRSDVPPPLALHFHGYPIHLLVYAEAQPPSMPMLITKNPIIPESTTENKERIETLIEKFIADLRSALRHTTIETLQNSSSSNFSTRISGGMAVMVDVEPIINFINYVGRSFLHKNLAVEIADYARLYGLAISSKPPERAILKSSAGTQYPTARKVFSDWIVKLPPYKPLQGNDYLPPDCDPISEQDLLRRTGDLPFDQFRHDHERAKQRVFGLRRVDVTPR